MNHFVWKNFQGAVFAATLGMLSVFPAGGPAAVTRDAPGQAPEAAPASSMSCGNERLDLQERIERLLDRRRNSGEIVFEGPDTLFAEHPLLATLALEAFRASGDYAFLKRAHGVIEGHVNRLLVYHDADRDFLIEGFVREGQGFPPDIEDVGFNAMLALDMLSLSQICVELDLPFDALFWYRGTKTVSTQLLQASFDPETLLFLPTRATSSHRENVIHGLSALPLFFASELGEEISLRMIRTHVLSGVVRPDGPGVYLSPVGGGDPPTDTAELALRSLLLLRLLEWNRLFDEAASRARGLMEASLRTAQDPRESGDEIVRYARCVIGSTGSRGPFPRHQELAVLDHLVFQKALLDPERVAALRRSITDIDAYLSSGRRSGGPTGTGETDLDAVSASIREVYFSISLLRDKWKQRTLFSTGDRAEIPGFDLYGAVSDLWDDVIETLQRVESEVSRGRWVAEGFDVTATVERTHVGPGEAAPLLFSFSSTAHDIRINKILVYRQQSVDTLWSSPSPLIVSPGDPPREIVHEFPLPRGRESSFVPLTCSVEVRFDDGRRARYHFRTSVIVTPPVTCEVVFPRGTTLNDGAVPIEIVAHKHVPVGASIQVQWYSPVGLRPAEGRSLEAWMPENTSEARMALSIPVPNPCRPGSFPFTLSVFANGEAIGTISSAFFRHYEWLFLGPLAGKGDALETRYPPETRIDPLATYSGALGRLGWRILPAAAYADGGKISLGTLLPAGSVGFLHTVIETAAQRRSVVLYDCGAPSVLSVNGEVVARTDDQGTSRLQRATVALRSGANNILIKTVSSANTDPVVFFQLGDEEDLMSDEFNNNLWELIDGYEELVARGRNRDAEAQEVQRQVTIIFRDPRATSVAVVGSFNGWSPDNSAMRKNKYGEWEINLYLSPGRYTYRLLVDNSKEVVDPTSPYTEPDGYGGQNSVLYVQ